jgi:hypothetical protein
MAESLGRASLELTADLGPLRHADAVLDALRELRDVDEMAAA